MELAIICRTFEIDERAERWGLQRQFRMPRYNGVRFAPTESLLAWTDLHGDPYL